ncbi:MAG: SUMF1/EgtB/PvdO family nonheme iron enzyme, partial [Planctomycetes bacterium]|nr:SUMF1/EgtB/PvdO family nonheme iron enzyme [Planctomycetota bacterium]
KPSAEWPIVLVLLPGGQFSEGKILDGAGASVGALVSVKPFFMSKYETTQAQYQRTMEDNPSHMFPGQSGRPIQPDDWLRPVESIAYYDACSFAQRLGLDVPTATEWEWACRGHGQHDYWWGSEFVAGHENIDNSVNGTFPVGRFSCNGFGLYDLQGNVSELTSTVIAEDLEAHNSGGRVRRFNLGNNYNVPLKASEYFSKSGVRHRRHAYSNRRTISIGCRLSRQLH